MKLMHQSGKYFVDCGRKRIPPRYEIVVLFATIVFLIYGWTSTAFFWKLPSWLFILNTSEIAVIIAYILTSDLLESLLVLALFLFASIVLPPRWLRDNFTVWGSVAMYIITFWASLFTLNSLIVLPTRSELLLIVFGLLASMGLAVFLVKRNSVVEQLIRGISQRLIIFLYVWIPLSLFALLVVIFRSLGWILGAL